MTGVGRLAVAASLSAADVILQRHSSSYIIATDGSL